MAGPSSTISLNSIVDVVIVDDIGVAGPLDPQFFGTHPVMNVDCYYKTETFCIDTVWNSDYNIQPSVGRHWRFEYNSVAAPTPWNDLPLNIRECGSMHSFKRLLKTYFFKRSFNI